MTKADLVSTERATEIAADVAARLAGTSLGGSPVVVASMTTGDGIPAVRAALIRLRSLAAARALGAPSGPRRLAVDRAFAVRGRGTVVTGSLRGGPIVEGDQLRVEPAGTTVRVRGVQVHHGNVHVATSGRAGLNVTGIGLEALARGSVLTAGAGIESSDRLLVALRAPARLSAGRRRANASSWPPADGVAARLHIGTAQVGAIVGRRGREAVELPDGTFAAILRLAEPVATFFGDRGVLRHPSPGEVIAGIRVLDPSPPRGVSRRRVSAERLAALAVGIAKSDVGRVRDAVVSLHGALTSSRVEAAAGALTRAPEPDRDGPGLRQAGLVLAPDLREAIEAEAVSQVMAHHREHPLDVGLPIGAVRVALSSMLRRLAAVRRDERTAADAAIDAVLAGLESRHRLVRDGDRLRDPDRTVGPTAELAAAMDRLLALLDVPAPPGLAAAAREAGCPPDGIRELEASGRIIRVESDLAWAAPAFQRLAARALDIARRVPLTPAALRDATGASRRYVVPVIEDLGRRGILIRTPAGHLPGPKAPPAAADPTSGPTRRGGATPPGTA